MLGNERSLEERINERIRQSSLGINAGGEVNGPDQGVYIDNPYSAINSDKATRIGPHSKGLKPDVGPSSELLLPNLDWQQATRLGFHRDRPIPSHDERIEIYLDWGAARAIKQPFVGVCETFNCVVIAMLTAQNSPLEIGTVVEYIGVKQGSVLGHAIAVIGRDNATEAIGARVPVPQQWGAGCIVVDQWYALQASTDPALHVAGPQVNEKYVEFLNMGTTSITLCGRFTVSRDRRPIKPRT